MGERGGVHYTLKKQVRRTVSGVPSRKEEAGRSALLLPASGG